MKKKSFLWLLPLAAALFLIVPSDLSALSAKDEKQLTKLEEKEAKLKPGKELSKSDRTKLDELRAAKEKEAQQIAPPSQDLGGALVAQTPTTAIAPQPETATVNLDGMPADGAPPDSNANSLGLTQKTGTEANNPPKEDPKTVVPRKDYPEWVSNPYSLERLIKEAIRNNNIDETDAGNEGLAKEFRLKDVYVGIGSATNAADSQAIQMAEARARQDLAFQQQALVKAEITDYSKNMTSTRGGKSNAAEDYIVAQQSIDIELTPVKVQIREKISGAWWVVVTATKVPEHRATVEEGPYIPSAMEAVKLMDQRLERNRIKSTGSPAASELGSEAISGMLDN